MTCRKVKVRLHNLIGLADYLCGLLSRKNFCDTYNKKINNIDDRGVHTVEIPPTDSVIN